MVGLALCCTGVFIANPSASSYIGHASATRLAAAAVGLYVTFYYVGGSAEPQSRDHFWSAGGWLACVALIATVQLATISLALVFWQPLPKVAGVPVLTAAIEEG